MFFLQDLQSVYHKNKYYCQSLVVSSGIVHVAKHFVFHANYDDAFEPMLFHLANRTDYKGYVERSRREDHDLAQQHHVNHNSRPSAAPKTKANAAPLNKDGLTDKTEGTCYDYDAAAPPPPPHEGPSDAAAGVQARVSGSKQDPLTPLPPRSSSLPTSARRIPASMPGRPDSQPAPNDTVLSGPCDDAPCIYKHFGCKTNADLNELAAEICLKLEPPPGMTSKVMSAAVLESIAGVEAIFKDGMAGHAPDVKRDVESVSLPSRYPSPSALLSD